MMARAVEPGAGESHGRANACLNCGTALIGEHCHHCGQAGHVHRSLSAWWHDLAHGILHLDGKVWRTLPLLVFRPGELTRRYIEGERARFVSPMAMFLFSVFLTFALVMMFGVSLGGTGGDAAGRGSAAAARQLDAEIAREEEQLAALEGDRAARLAAGESTETIDRQIADLKSKIAVTRDVIRDTLDIASGQSTGERFVEPFNQGPTPVDIDPGEPGFQTGIAAIDGAVKKAQGNTALLLYKIQNNAYKFSWALIPISVPFVWLLFFWRRQFRVYDHTVFVTYSIAFMSLGFITLSLLPRIGVAAEYALLAMMLIPPVHMYKQLRGAYSLSRFSAAWRTVALLNFAFMAGGLFFTLLLGIGAFA